MKATATLKAGATPHVPYRYDPAVYDYTYNVVDNNDNETRSWDDKMYFMPISRNEINRNNLLIQNPGY
ncbi:RagB/SusD family nutrient uptake outer membrane protein [Maribacter litopenaei]|uniref:RagB/SusD family nutrient uptake outer membrane protein n=2 Tax=Maribacter litopenaei TaxID=2976127 RepID=A0ABY5YFQ5_9FLAO|nr:RagB/SusD family nutrient uptake outer membrane protein [Maribacter litopenaei]UWX56671.1 RagB/SusD family nutrient uptake outer membrane protein [Maribacter litopenaei]